VKSAGSLQPALPGFRPRNQNQPTTWLPRGRHPGADVLRRAEPGPGTNPPGPCGGISPFPPELGGPWSGCRSTTSPPHRRTRCRHVRPEPLACSTLILGGPINRGSDRSTGERLATPLCTQSGPGTPGNLFCRWGPASESNHRGPSESGPWPRADDAAPINTQPAPWGPTHRCTRATQEGKTK